MSLQISHFWGKDPFWFATLPRAAQVTLLAHYRIENETPKEAEKRKKRYNNDIIDQQIKKMRARQL